MRLLNATHERTDKLVQYGLVDQGIALYGDVLMPGKILLVQDEAKKQIEAEHAHLFAVGALRWEEKTPNALVDLTSSTSVDDKAEVTLKPAKEEKKKR